MGCRSIWAITGSGCSAEMRMRPGTVVTARMWMKWFSRRWGRVACLLAAWAVLLMALAGGRDLTPLPGFKPQVPQEGHSAVEYRVVEQGRSYCP